MERWQTFEYPIKELPAVVMQVLECDDWKLDQDGHHWVKWMLNKATGKQFRMCVDVDSDDEQECLNTALALLESSKAFLQEKNIYYHDVFADLDLRVQIALVMCMACILDGKEDCRLNFDAEENVWDWIPLNITKK